MSENGNGHVRVEEVNLTPALAEAWRARNVRNRPLSDGTVLRYANSILAGEWQFNGDTITFDSNGDLIDGQHRIEAVIVAGKPIKTLVVNGIVPEAFITKDQGMARTGGHILALKGEKHYNVLSGALSWLWKYQRGRMLDTGPRGTLSKPQMVQLLEQNPGIRDSVAQVGAGAKCKAMVAGSAASFLHYQFAQSSRSKADEFFDLLKSGAGLVEDSPIYLLRERLIRNKDAKAKLRQVDIIALCIKAWNAFSTGRPMRTLRWTNRGDTPEDFPEIL